MAKLVETFCLKMLQEAGVDFLFGLTEEYRIPVDDANKEDKNYLVKVLLRHLASETIEQSTDKGAGVFLKLYNELGEELGTLGATAGAAAGGVKKEASIPKLEDTEDDGGIETLSYRKLRQFKINGTIGDPGQKGCIPFSSLCYQIRQGEGQGYKIQEIYSGVIRAIEAGNPLRDVLELEAEDFDKKEFMKTLRSHFMEGDPNEMLNDLRIALQGPKETAHKFCCRCVALKKKVIKMYQADETSFDMENVTSTFYRTIYTGLRQTNIKNELRQVLREKLLSDGDLLKEVAEAQGNEEERLRKLGESEKKVSVNHITCDSDSDETQSSSDSSSFCGHSSGSSANKPLSKRQQRKANKQAGQIAPKSQQGGQQKNQQNSKNSQNSQDTYGVEVSKLTAAIEKLSSSNAQLTAEVSVLKTKVEGTAPSNSHTPKPPPFAPRPLGNNGNNNNPANRGPSLAPPSRPNPTAPPYVAPSVGYTNSRRPIYLCPNCIQSNSSWCRHCFICGSDQHKVRDCTEN